MCTIQHDIPYCFLLYNKELDSPLVSIVQAIFPLVIYSTIKSVSPICSRLYNKKRYCLLLSIVQWKTIPTVFFSIGQLSLYPHVVLYCTIRLVFPFFCCTIKSTSPFDFYCTIWMISPFVFLVHNKSDIPRCVVQKKELPLFSITTKNDLPLCSYCTIKTTSSFVLDCTIIRNLPLCFRLYNRTYPNCFLLYKKRFASLFPIVH